ncbi:hypothetical protein [Modestobacter sp. URMC 112]
MIGGDDVRHLQASSEHALIAKRVLSHVEPLTQLSPISWRDFQRHLPELTARAVVMRQVEGLKATLELCRGGLGHLGIGFIRQALEEVIWLEYVKQLEHGIANQLLGALAASDGARGVAAARSYLSDERMITIGFPQGFLDYNEEQRLESMKLLKAIGVRLGWPKGQAPPNMRWLAGKVDRLAVYEYLHSASSRFVHFSSGEVFRRGWADEASMLIRFDNENHRLYLSRLALSELIPLLLDAAAVALDLADDDDLPELVDPGSFRTDIERFVDLGMIPMVLPGEFNLDRNQQSGRNSS